MQRGGSCSKVWGSRGHPECSRNDHVMQKFQLWESHCYQDASKSSPNPVKIDPKGHLEPMLDQCFIKVQVWRPEKTPKGARECPKEVRNLPKWIQKLFKRPLGAHLGPMFLKDMSWNAQLTAKMRPKVAPWRPAASQTPPKWSPKTLPNQIFEHSLGLFVYGCKFACFFGSFVAEFVCFLKSRPLKFMRPRSVLLTSTRSGIFRKNIKNRRKILPKPSPNRVKIEEKSRKIWKDRWKQPRWVRKAKNCVKNAKKLRKVTQHSPQTKKFFWPRRDTRDPLSTP